MKKLLLSIILLANAFAVFAQTIPAANHNFGCAFNSDDGLANESKANVQTILPSGEGNRTTPSELAGTAKSSAWWNVAGNIISTVKDGQGHDVYKFTPAQGATECQGGFDFGNVNDNGQYPNISANNTYVHVALYLNGNNTAGKTPSVKIRIATPGGNGVNKPFQQYQKDSKSHTLQAGWNYLNLRVDGFDYDRIQDDNNKHFDATKLSQVGIILTDVNDQQNIYVDDIYTFVLEFSKPNWNFACASDNDEGITGESDDNVQPITTAGNRAHVDPVQNGWDRVTTSTKTIDNHNYYEFTSTGDNASAGFNFSSHDVSAFNTYLHAAVYAPEAGTVKIRIANDVSSDWNKYQVESPLQTLKLGWNYLNLRVYVKAIDRIAHPDDKIGFAYNDCQNTFNFDPSKVSSLGFVFPNTGTDIFADDVYFYTLPYTTVDNDGENIDWNTPTESNPNGTTDQVKSVFQPSDETAYEAQDPIENANDEDNSTYYGIATEVANTHTTEDNAYYFVTELQNPITVSDVEMVWGNGYPMQYKVYTVAADDAPKTEGTNTIKANNLWTLADVKALCKDEDSNLLFYRDKNMVVPFEPYYNTTSELDKRGGQYENGTYKNGTKYLVVKMWNPKDNLQGFKLNEIHIGAYQDDYYTIDHLSAPNLSFPTEEYNHQKVEVTIRNKRNAILNNSGHSISSINYAIEGGNDLFVKLEKMQDADYVYSTKPGNYVMNITGTVDGVEYSNPGKVQLVVTRDWRGKDTHTKSIIQDLKADAFSATSTEKDASGNPAFPISNIGDDNLDTRWSTGGDAASALNQYVIINLNDKKVGNQSNDSVYQVRDLEFLWERAYPAKYSVYAFNAVPDTANVTYDTFATTHDANKLYEGTLQQGWNIFPYRDLHVTGTGDDDIKKALYDSKYIVVAFANSIKQPNGNQYGVSAWEMYAQAVNWTNIANMTEISAKNKVMYYNTTRYLTIQGVNTNVTPNKTVVTQLNDARFYTLTGSDATANGNLATTITSEVDQQTQTTVYYVKSDINKDGNSVQIAKIYDAGNNTYAIQTSDDKAVAYKTYNIGVTYTRPENNNSSTTFNTTFTLTILKKPMEKVVGSTDNNIVFDDGYYVKERLEKYATNKVLTVDLRAVDFTTDDNDAPLATTEIPAPRKLNVDSNGKLSTEDLTFTYRSPSEDETTVVTTTEAIAAGLRLKMNPNAVYYVSQNAFNVNGTTNTLIGINGVHGENVVLKDNRDNSTANNWYIENLRVFDGYNFAPEDPLVNPRNTANDGKIYAHNAIFYTNIPEKIKSTLVLPFDVRNTEISKLNFFTPATLDNTANADTALLKIDSLALDETHHPVANTVYIVEAQEGANTVSKTGGYAVQMVSTSYKVPNEVVEVAKAGSTTEVTINGTNETAKIVGTFMNNDISQIAGVNYLYSVSNHAFLPANSDYFNYDSSKDGFNENVDDSWKGKDLRNVVLPFYVYLNIPEAAESAAPAKIGFYIGSGDETTGISNISTDESAGIDFNAPVYDLMGRRVNKSYRGIVIQKGKKYLMK